jgi:hypothetical protein
MSAVSLGRMRAERALPDLRKSVGTLGRNTEAGQACYWAIERITGEPAPPPEVESFQVTGWFLEPLGR